MGIDQHVAMGGREMGMAEALYVLPEAVGIKRPDFNLGADTPGRQGLRQGATRIFTAFAPNGKTLYLRISLSPEKPR